MPRSSPPETKSPAHLQGDGTTGDLPALGGEMGFLDHLEELRWSLFKGMGGVLVATALCAFFSDWILQNILLGPTRSDFFMYRVLGLEAEPLQLLNRTITGQFFAHLGTILAVGIVVGSPIFVYFLWRFIEPALYPHEKSGLRFASAFATFFFMLGIAFGYLLLTPLALQFFQTYQIGEQVINEFDITRYFSMITYWALGTGILFEMPVAIYFFTKIGVLSAEVLRKYRKFALIIILVLAAFVTPPEPLSQIIVAVPLLLLYEISIYISTVTERRRRRQLAKFEKAAQERGETA